MAKSDKIDPYAATPNCARFPKGATVLVTRPHLWAGYSGIVEIESNGIHRVVLKGRWCDFQANVPGQMLVSPP